MSEIKQKKKKVFIEFKTKEQRASLFINDCIRVSTLAELGLISVDSETTTGISEHHFNIDCIRFIKTYLEEE